MKNKIITAIILGMFLISMASSLELVGGECQDIDFPNEAPVQFEVSGNSSDISGLNWTKNGTIITLCLDIDFASDNFTMTWGNSEQIQESSSGVGDAIISKVGVKEGFNILVSKGSKFYFYVEDRHKMTLLEVNEIFAKVRIESDPQEVMLKVGDSKIIELDGKKINITLKSITNGRHVKLFIKLFDEEGEDLVCGGNCYENKTKENISIGKDEEKIVSEEDLFKEIPKEKVIFWNTLIGVLVIIIIVALVLLIAFKLGKLKEEDGNQE